MCGGSRAVKKSTDAKQGATYGISTVGVHGLPTKRIGALHALGSTVDDCVHCIQDGQKVTLSNIPAELRRQLALGESAVAVFEDSANFERDDVLDFGNRKRVSFRKFADVGIVLYIGEKSRTDLAVAGIIADATKPAEDAGTHKRELADV